MGGDGSRRTFDGRNVRRGNVLRQTQMFTDSVEQRLDAVENLPDGP